MNNKAKVVLIELKSHAPFTLFGAFTGILCMFLFKGIEPKTAETVFYVFHPAHVLLSGMATAAMYLLYAKKRNIITVMLIGIVGAIGVATLSDSVIPYIGEHLLGMRISGHGHAHGGSHEGETAAEAAGHEGAHDHESDAPAEESAHLHEQADETAVEAASAHAHDPETEGAAAHDHEGDESFAEKAHIGFIEMWYVIFPMAIGGVLIAYLRPKTRFPHTGHVLLSTWASSFHILMEMGGKMTAVQALGSFVFLFLAVWLPCCISDIIFPLLFVKSEDIQACCHH